MEKENKIFEEWEDVDCNQCEHYYTNTCDGVQKGKKRTCSAFKASRGIVIPEEIRMLKTRLKWLTVALLLMATSILLHYFTMR